MTLFSTEGEPSSMFCRLVLPVERGMLETPWGRLSLTGLSKMLVAESFMLSMEVGSSFAPGGTVFLLGLPCGVLTGVVKLFGAVPLVGVVGRSSVLLSVCFPPGKKLDMKLAILRDAMSLWWNG